MAQTPSGIYYEDLGKGTPLVILRGLGRSIDHWLGFEKLLAQDCRVVMIENRGVHRSKSAPFKMNASMKDYCDDIISVLDELKIERAHVMGISLGGMMALGCGLYFPERCHSLHAVNASTATSGLRISLSALFNLILSPLSPEKQEQRLAKLLMLSTDEKKVKKVVEESEAILKEFQPSTKLVASQLIAAAKFFARKQLKKLKIPTQIIVSDTDRFTPTHNSKMIHKMIPGSTLTMIKGAGHEVYYDQPEKLKQVVLDYM